MVSPDPLNTKAPGTRSPPSLGAAWCQPVILAVELEIHCIETIAIASYDGKRQETPRVLKACENSGDGWLVVDDIVDTGKTAEIVRNLLPETCFVAIYAKPDGAPFVDRYATEVPQDVWIAFPWEKPAEPT